jgi:hypothetical protein
MYSKKFKSNDLVGTLLDFPDELFIFIQDKDYNVVVSGLYNLKDHNLQIRDKDLTNGPAGKILKELYSGVKV